MHTSNDSYRNEQHRDELALRMIRHEARTCTIRECTGLSDDRIRWLHRIYASQADAPPVHRRRGRSPRQINYFTRNTCAQFESSLLASSFIAFGLLHAQRGDGAGKVLGIEPDSIEYSRLFCDAYETHQQLLNTPTLSFEHAWFLLQLLNRSGDLHSVRCRHCDSHYLQDRFNVCRHTCPTCKLKRTRSRRANGRAGHPCSTANPPAEAERD